MVRAVRGNPFAEWIVVFYDAKKTDTKKLLARVQAKGCPEAGRVEPKPEEKSGVRAAVENAVAVPGDYFHVAIDGAKEAPAVTAPEGWSVVTSTSGRVNVQTPAKAKSGTYTLVLKFGDDEMKFPVELVIKVRE